MGNVGGNGVPNNPQGGQMPMNGGAPGNRGTATLRGKLGGKTIGIIAAISLGCRHRGHGGHERDLPVERTVAFEHDDARHRRPRLR